MDRSIRRAVTITGSTLGALALFTGTASAHYCYTLKGTDGNKVNGTAWVSAEQTAADLQLFLPPGECQDALVAHVRALGAQGALFLGPGLLAGGAAKKGQLPEGVGHLFQDAASIPACGFLFEE
jgi:hypothetical protein